jgi:hypothetical protein
MIGKRVWRTGAGAENFNVRRYSALRAESPWGPQTAISFIPHYRETWTCWAVFTMIVHIPLPHHPLFLSSGLCLRVVAHIPTFLAVFLAEYLNVGVDSKRNISVAIRRKRPSGILSLS